MRIDQDAERLQHAAALLDLDGIGVIRTTLDSRTKRTFSLAADHEHAAPPGLRPTYQVDF